MDGPVFHLEPIGLFANRMIQYMAALKFVGMVPGCRISNVHLPDWGIGHPAIDSPGPVEFVRDRQHIDLPGLAARANARTIRRVDWSGYGQRLENFPPRDICAEAFVPPNPAGQGFGDKYLVCHVRAGDILNGIHPDYPLTPVEFFADLVAETGLEPIFMGQTEPNAYTDRLRDRFPKATFLPTRDVVTDFETIRQSENLVVGVSTFAWLAGWLSTRAQNIFLAVNGLLNPMQAPHVDLLPFGDARFRFYLFPLNYGVELDRHAEVHRRMSPYWRYVAHADLKIMLDQAPRFDRSPEPMLAAFDEAYYLDANADVADAVAAGRLPSGLVHYAHYGFRERRFPFALDRSWYASEYPMAGLEVSQGDYTDFTHHYLAEGRARGYRPLPPE